MTLPNTIKTDISITLTPEGGTPVVYKAGPITLNSEPAQSVPIESSETNPMTFDVFKQKLTDLINDENSYINIKVNSDDDDEAISADDHEMNKRLKPDVITQINKLYSDYNSAHSDNPPLMNTITEDDTKTTALIKIPPNSVNINLEEEETPNNNYKGGGKRMKNRSSDKLTRRRKLHRKRIGGKRTKNARK
jgi:hypothetical protein